MSVMLTPLDSVMILGGLSMLSLGTSSGATSGGRCSLSGNLNLSCRVSISCVSDRVVAHAVSNSLEVAAPISGDVAAGRDEVLSDDSVPVQG